VSNPTISPVTGIPPASAPSALRAEILAAAEATLEGIVESATTPAQAKPAATATKATTTSTTTAVQPAAPPPNAVAHAVDVARAIAAQRQAGLAPLFADLAQAVNSPALPPALRAAIGRVLALQTPINGPLTAETVRQAVAQSGLFLEAHLAQASPGAQAAPDLKAALLSLQTALAAVPARKAPPQPAGPEIRAAPPTIPTTTPGTPPSAARTPPPTEATPATLAASPQSTDPKTALLDLQEIPTASERPAEQLPAPTAEPSAAPKLQTAPADMAPAPPPAVAANAAGLSPPPGAVETAAPATDAALIARQSLLDQPPEPLAGLATRSQGLAPDPKAGAAIPPPHRDAALAAQPAPMATLRLDAKTPAIVQHLQAEVEQAVARQTLHQLASLPDGQTNAWMFELPLATPEGAAIAHFEIQRDGRGPHDAEETADGWRLRFSIDIEPLGPVHIHLGLNGDHAQVMVWAERETSLQWLRQGAADLANALPAEVVFHPGAPRRPTPAPGRFVDQAL
jgi:hypothetical protein